MALKALLLRKKIDDKKKALDALRAKDADFLTREQEIEAAINELPDDASAEDRQAVEETVNQFDADKQSHEDAKSSLAREIGELEADLDNEEADSPAEPVESNENTDQRRDDYMNMTTRAAMFGATAQERTAFFARDDVKNYLAEVRTCIREKRALTNVGLTIPEVMLGILRENIQNYSKLYKHVNVRRIAGEGRMVIEGTIPEAVWTDCCANLNELNLGFNDVEVGCWKVGGYFAVCNATLEDSDIELAAELLAAIGQAIGLALDKAILYGTGTRMPLGVVTRLVQTAAPADYPATARTWADLHTTNIQSITAANSTGIKLFQDLATAAAAAKGKYARAARVWVMNETTYTALQVQAMSINAAGAIVSGMGNTMPVVGGAVELLEFVPNNVIIFGYFELYLLAERAGNKFATSEHVRFLQDQTVFKGTARYDGKPAIAEAFAAVGINATTPNAIMPFVDDTANSEVEE